MGSTGASGQPSRGVAAASLRPVDMPAASMYETHLRVRGRVPNLLLVPFEFLRNLLLGWLVSSAWVAPACIDVVRKSDGGVIGHIPAGSDYYEQVDVLAAVRESLESDSRVEFLMTWQLSDESGP